MNARPVGAAPLTPRQAEVLCLAAEGLTDREIATRLDMNYRTVNRHMLNLRGHLHARNRTHAVTLAIALGLIHLHPTPDHPTRFTPHTPTTPPQPTQRVWQLLADAGPAGTNPAWIARQLGRPNSDIYLLLRQWANDGLAEPIGSGWRTTTRIRAAAG